MTTTKAADPTAATRAIEAEFAYFPGCTSCSTGLAYELSTQYMAHAIGLTLHEIPDWNCCGASAAHLINHDLSLALPARSLAISQDELPGLAVVAPCAACFARLKNARHYVNQSQENRAHIEGLIERVYRGEEQVYSLLQAVAENDAIKEALQAKLQKSLNGLKLACYYGCVLVRPAEIVEFDDAENPQSMDELMRLIGAEPVDWAYKTECCGASLQVTEPSAGKIMVERILRNAEENGAEGIVTACPLCQLNVDMRQKEVNRLTGSDYSLPVYYFTELISMCLGAEAREVGIDKHYYPAIACAERATQPPAPEADEAAEAATQTGAKAKTGAGASSAAVDVTAADSVPANAAEKTGEVVAS
jgi:heterodisulfide reductase subunit B